MRYIGNNLADIQSETMKARRQWNGIFQELKSRIPSPGNVFNQTVANEQIKGKDTGEADSLEFYSVHHFG